jgi:N-acetylneuraminic acid mutarotase
MSLLSRRSLLCVALPITITACGPASTGTPSLTWQQLPDLPQPLGGQMVGVHNGALLVAGGSYFETPPWDGGPKLWVDTVYALSAPNASWQTFHLPGAFGYAGSVSTPEGVLLIGGGNSAANRREVLRLVWNGSTLQISLLPPLPVPLANAGAGYLGGKAYVVGGQESPTATAASAALYSFDPASALWRKEADLPGPARILPAVAVAGDHLYVCSGAQLSAGPDGKPARRYLQDAWRFSPASGWESLPAAPRPAVAATSWGTDAGFFVFGGDDGSLAAQPDLRERHPGFPRDVLFFNPERRIWETISRMPAGLVTTGATLWHDRIVIAGGEDRPAHRSAEVFSCNSRFP